MVEKIRKSSGVLFTQVRLVACNGALGLTLRVALHAFCATPSWPDEATFLGKFTVNLMEIVAKPLIVVKATVACVLRIKVGAIRRKMREWKFPS